MYLLLSGEGPSDMGSSADPNLEIAEGNNFKPGPMAVILDQIFEAIMNNSILDTEGALGFISKTQLESVAMANRRTGPKLKIPKKNE